MFQPMHLDKILKCHQLCTSCKHFSNKGIKMIKTLVQGELNVEYVVKSIETVGDEEMEKFLFSLGCYEGQKVTIVSKLNKNFVITIKDARYSIDESLANAILIN